MKAAFFLAAAGLVAAQDLSGQPQCALKCLQEYIPKAGCELDDTACQCESSFQTKLAPLITPCLTEACKVEDLLKAQQAAVDACKAYAATAGAGSTTVAPTESLGSVTVSIDTSITGSASVPAIFSSIPDEKPIPPVTPRPGNGTVTKTSTEGAGGATTPTGTSGGGNGGASSVPTDAGAGAVAGPALGLLAAIAAAIAL
ncbi:cell wall [Fusarium longipes]|uniref:Cell wall n=1 Tax=Fusarium longipes TaxID=694270 RepID=A0A395S479_9HYPO|nr:cell wall [Fusarium longipes]